MAKKREGRVLLPIEKEKECIQVFRNTRLLCLLYETPTISFRNIMLLLEWHTYYIKDDKVEII